MADNEIQKRSPKFKDRTGQQFGRLTAMRPGPIKRFPSGSTQSTWECRCSCGSSVTVMANKLSSGHTRSCGCLQAEVRLTHSVKHGMAATTEYRIWQAIKDRCLNKDCPAYDRYGGRGVAMSPDWVDDFAAFYEYVGDRPDGMSLDRINNDGNYEPGNVRWATPTQQANNRRDRCRKTHCIRGHELTPENVYVQKKTGYRYCRACRAVREGRKR